MGENVIVIQLSIDGIKTSTSRQFNCQLYNCKPTIQIRDAWDGIVHYATSISRTAAIRRHELSPLRAATLTFNAFALRLFDAAARGLK